MKFPTKLYLGGELRTGQDTIAVDNPATEDHVATICAAGLDDVQEALECARDAFVTWSKTSIIERQQWMNKLRDEVIANEEYLRLCIHYEMGKTWAATQEDFDSLKNSLEFYAQEIANCNDFGIKDRAGTHNHQMVYEPAGVAVAFLAWNFPLLNLAFKIGPAMAAGCPIIIRPSSDTPISAYAVGELCAKIGLPKGVVQIIATKTYEAADALSASTIPAVITLIGSTATGQHIMRTGATSIKKYSMELGGNAPVLVFEDADLKAAADIVCGIKFNNAGQICVAPTVLGNVSDTMAVYREETFGPIVSIIPFDDEDGLLDRANDCDDGGLTAYIFTRALERAEHYAAALRYGEIQINGVKYDIDLPHGGIGQSGIGHDCSYLALHDYLILKRITRAL